MNTAIVVAIITVLGTAVSFFLTKQKEREAEWRKQKLDHYKEFMAALNDIAGPPPTINAKVRFASAANNIFLVGSPSVLSALRAFLDETAESNTQPSIKQHDELLTALIFAIRDDLGIKPNKPKGDYQFHLWTGKPSKN